MIINRTIKSIKTNAIGKYLMIRQISLPLVKASKLAEQVREVKKGAMKRATTITAMIQNKNPASMFAFLFIG